MLPSFSSCCLNPSPRLYPWGGRSECNFPDSYKFKRGCLFPANRWQKSAGTSPGRGFWGEQQPPPRGLSRSQPVRALGPVSGRHRRRLSCRRPRCAQRGARRAVREGSRRQAGSQREMTPRNQTEMNLSAGTRAFKALRHRLGWRDLSWSHPLWFFSEFVLVNTGSYFGSATQ